MENKKIGGKGSSQENKKGESQKTAESARMANRAQNSNSHYSIYVLGGVVVLLVAILFFIIIGGGKEQQPEVATNVNVPLFTQPSDSQISDVKAEIQRMQQECLNTPAGLGISNMHAYAVFDSQFCEDKGFCTDTVYILKSIAEKTKSPCSKIKDIGLRYVCQANADNKVALCDKISDSTKKTICNAVMSGNDDLCEQLALQDDKEVCYITGYIKSAVASGSITGCDDQKYPAPGADIIFENRYRYRYKEFQDICRSVVSNDPSYYMNSKSSYCMDLAIRAIAEQHNMDLSLCSDITNLQMKADCEYAVNTYATSTQLTKDMMILTNATKQSECSQITNQTLKSDCMIMKANPVIPIGDCSKLQVEQFKQDCVLNWNLNTMHVSKTAADCEKATDAEIKKACLAIVAKDPKACLNSADKEAKLYCVFALSKQASQSYCSVLTEADLKARCEEWYKLLII